jgi:hypothetical protein
MMSVATVGVDIHMANIPVPPVKPSMLISKAAPTARTITSTAKMAALVASVSFVNITEPPLPHRLFSATFLPSGR